MNDKTSYQPISLLRVIPKLFEKVLYEQLEIVAMNIFSRKICWFRKGDSLQNVVLNLLKNWQIFLDMSGVAETVLMVLSKVYDCLPQNSFSINY